MGMMSGVYFVGRGELIQWINDLLQLNYTKVEDTSNGAAFCQVIDAIHPGTVHLGHVKFDAYMAPDVVNNYKVLQEAFDKNGIKQYIDVDTLVKGRYMAALELFQWIHGYYKSTDHSEDYDPVARRKHFRCKEPKGSVSSAKPAGMAKRRGAGGIDTAAPKPSGVRAGAIPGREAADTAMTRKKVVTKEVQEKPAKKPAAAPAPAPAPERVATAPAASTKELKEAKKKIEELNDEIEQANQERDFYYGKLRDIEDYCQSVDENETIKKILEILYKTDEANGFQAPDDDEDEYDE
jgi:RP/EB family microtubule-associated protein